MAFEREKYWESDLDKMDSQFQTRIKAVLKATDRVAGNERMQHLWANTLRELDYTYKKVRNLKRSISFDWDIDDVNNVRPDLSPDQAMSVLERINKLYDPNVGVNYDTIRMTAIDLFGTARTTEKIID
jgi:hypothetical protein